MGNFFLVTVSDQNWGPSCLVSNGYRRLLPGGKAAGAWSWPLTSI